MPGRAPSSTSEEAGRTAPFSGKSAGVAFRLPPRARGARGGVLLQPAGGLLRRSCTGRRLHEGLRHLRPRAGAARSGGSEPRPAQLVGCARGMVADLGADGGECSLEDRRLVAVAPVLGVAEPPAASLDHGAAGAAPVLRDVLR